MQQKNLLKEFQREWKAFIRDRGHKVGDPQGIGCVLQSSDPAKKCYRWLLLFAQGKSKTLNRAEIEDMRHHLKRARRLKQKAYMVINYQKPVGKVIVLPADRVLKRKRILPSKGGIPWGD